MIKYSIFIYTCKLAYSDVKHTGMGGVVGRRRRNGEIIIKVGTILG
jgi:hypothetical protein